MNGGRAMHSKCQEYLLHKCCMVHLSSVQWPADDVWAGV